MHDDPADPDLNPAGDAIAPAAAAPIVRQKSGDATHARNGDPFGRIRRAIRELHLWIGLVLCLPLIVLGLSGSILVFRGGLATLLNPPPHLICARGKSHTVAEIIASAQARTGKWYEPYLYEPPAAPGQPATVRLRALERARGGMSALRVILVDPVSLDARLWHYKPFPGFLEAVLRLHGNLLLGPGGRAYVGWLGIASLVLGVSGLVLWWPRRTRQRAAFVVKGGARGLRLHRDLHGAVGIWSFAVFIAVSFSGVYFAFPRTVGAGVRMLLPSQGSSHTAPILKGNGVHGIDADAAIAAAISAPPGARLVSIALPPRPGQPYRVSLARSGDGPGASETVAIINPWSGDVVGMIDPNHLAATESA